MKSDIKLTYAGIRKAISQIDSFIVILEKIQTEIYTQKTYITSANNGEAISALVRNYVELSEKYAAQIQDMEKISKILTNYLQAMNEIATATDEELQTRIDSVDIHANLNSIKAGCITFKYPRGLTSSYDFEETTNSNDSYKANSIITTHCNLLIDIETKYDELNVIYQKVKDYETTDDWYALDAGLLTAANVKWKEMKNDFKLNLSLTSIKALIDTIVEIGSLIINVVVFGRSGIVILFSKVTGAEPPEWAISKYQEGISLLKNIKSAWDDGKLLESIFQMASDGLDEEGILYAGALVVIEIVGTKGLGKLAKVSKLKKLDKVSDAMKIAESSSKVTPLNTGHLTEDVAKSFRTASYTKVELSADTVMYRVHGGTAEEIGSYMSITPQRGGLQSQLDLALKPIWGNTTENVSVVTVPKGTTIYQGISASQNILDSLGNVVGVLPGGGNQIYIPDLDIGWFK